MKLYDIPAELDRFEQQLIENAGELTPELEQDWKDFINGSKEKIEAAAFVVKRIETDAATCKAEVERLEARQHQMERNAKRLKDLMIYAVDALGGKVKTPLVTVWSQTSAPTVRCELKHGSDLVQIEGTNPNLVRTKREPNLVEAKTVYQPLWDKYLAELDLATAERGPEPGEAAIERFNQRMDAYWIKLLEDAGLPDCFHIINSPGTPYLRIK